MQKNAHVGRRLVDSYALFIFRKRIVRFNKGVESSKRINRTPKREYTGSLLTAQQKDASAHMK
jgi:hypothetical protein